MRKAASNLTASQEVHFEAFEIGKVMPHAQQRPRRWPRPNLVWQFGQNQFLNAKIFTAQNHTRTPMEAVSGRALSLFILEAVRQAIKRHPLEPIATHQKARRLRQYSAAISADAAFSEVKTVSPISRESLS